LAFTGKEGEMTADKLKRANHVSREIAINECALGMVKNNRDGVRLLELFEDFPHLKEMPGYRHCVKKARKKLIWDIRVRIADLTSEFEKL
jgi:hypothetical protein